MLLSIPYCLAAAAQEVQVSSITNTFASSKLDLRQTDLTSSSVTEESSTGEPANASGAAAGITLPPPPKEPRSTRSFRGFAFGIKATTLGAGAEIATPLTRSINLRSGINVFSFAYPFTIDGVNYNSVFHYKSSQSTLDWFPLHGRFHISPGILYSRNTLTANASVGPGQGFELGDQPFTNTVDDPLTGTMSVVYPHKYSPLLLAGFGNILPRTGRHLSMPIEFGVAYTGAPTINVNLNGTACTTEGCVSFANNAEAQASLKQEVQNLNEDLKRLPVYPILSLGFAYRF
jgi:hypothetical protein